jgi:hypothetical protein
MSPTETTAREIDTPVLECPAWCRASHGGEFGGTSHQLRRDIDGEDKDSGRYVTLYMTDYGTRYPALADHNGTIRIHLTWREGKTVLKELDQAEDFAETAEVFGRFDIAAIIREFAKLGRETSPTKVQFTPADQEQDQRQAQ